MARSKGYKAKFKPNKLADISKLVQEYAQDEFNALISRGEMLDIGRNIMKGLMDDRGFNDYSGNMSRSYYVAISGPSGIQRIFSVNDEVVPSPDIGSVGRGNLIYYITHERHSPKGKRHFKVQHIIKRNKKGEITKVIKADLAYRYLGQKEPYGKHAYMERVLGKQNKQRFRRGAAGYIINIGNDTPYAPMVQARGYQVMNIQRLNEYRKRVKRVSDGAVKVAVKNMCYDLQKQGYKGWFDNRLRGQIFKKK